MTENKESIVWLHKDKIQIFEKNNNIDAPLETWGQKDQIHNNVKEGGKSKGHKREIKT